MVSETFTLSFLVYTLPIIVRHNIFIFIFYLLKIDTAHIHILNVHMYTNFSSLLQIACFTPLREYICLGMLDVNPCFTLHQ